MCVRGFDCVYCYDFLDYILKLFEQCGIFCHFTTSKNCYHCEWLSTEHLCHKLTTDMYQLVLYTFRSFPHSWLITGIVTRVTLPVLLVEQELPTIPEHFSSPTHFSGVHVTRSLASCVMCRSLFVLLSFFLWPLCCLFDLRILITPLVSSNYSYRMLRIYLIHWKRIVLEHCFLYFRLQW